MIVVQAQLSADRAAAKKQAESATEVARKLMENQDPAGDNKVCKICKVSWTCSMSLDKLSKLSATNCVGW